MSKVSSDRHEFALFYPDLGKLTVQASLVCTDLSLVHRLKHVLRVDQGDRLILFNDSGVAHVVCADARDKKKIFFVVEDFFQQQPIQPFISVLLPILKRDAFYEALYSCVELAVSHIHLVITAKAQRSWFGSHDMHKIKLVMQAAAEQSKQFCLPQVHGPVGLTEGIAALSSENTIRLVADACGTSCVKLMQAQLLDKNSTVVCAIGPEGDFAHQEKELLIASGFISASLSPTVLRSSQAVAVMLGIIRSQWS